MSFVLPFPLLRCAAFRAKLFPFVPKSRLSVHFWCFGRFSSLPLSFSLLRMALRLVCSRLLTSWPFHQRFQEKPAIVKIIAQENLGTAKPESRLAKESFCFCSRHWFQSYSLPARFAGFLFIPVHPPLSSLSLSLSRSDKKNSLAGNAGAGMLPGALAPSLMHERLSLAKPEFFMHFYLAKSGLLSHQVGGKAWLGRSGHAKAKCWRLSSQNISDHECDFLGTNCCFPLIHLVWR